MIRPVSNPRVWRSVKHLYLGAGVLFLVNISLGFLNIVTEGALGRGQLLAHLHAGSIGWITLSVIATTIWAFTGQRQVSDRYARNVDGFVWGGLAAAGGYVAAFYLTFTELAPFWLLAVFGVLTALVIWTAFLYTAFQLRRQWPVTTVHLLFFGALMVASVAATMGVLRGLTYSTGISPTPPGGDLVGAHAGPMDVYLALAFAGFVELMARPEEGQRWSRWGMTQMVLGVAGGLLAAAGLFAGIGPLIPLGTLGLVLSFVVYLARIGWRPLARNPFGNARDTALAWGALAYPVYIGLFVFLVAKYFSVGQNPPHALLVAFTHVTFIGLATNLILAMQSWYPLGRPGPGKLEAAGVWLLNLGLLAFIAGEFMAERADGAAIMGLGALLALIAIARRLANEEPPVDRRDPVV